MAKGDYILTQIWRGSRSGWEKEKDAEKENLIMTLE
jgi:hypothetical protein